jgi:hypothetical protein
LRFQFDKSRHLFIGARNETLSVVAMCISNEDRSARTHTSRHALQNARSNEPGRVGAKTDD